MGRTEEVMITFGVSLLFLPLLTGFAEAQCEISVKNVGHEPFTWHMEYADGWIYERNLTYGAHDNFECACVPHDMKIIYQVSKERFLSNFPYFVGLLLLPLHELC